MPNFSASPSLLRTPSGSSKRYELPFLGLWCRTEEEINVREWSSWRKQKGKKRKLKKLIKGKAAPARESTWPGGKDRGFCVLKHLLEGLSPSQFHRGHCLIPKELPVRQESDMKGNEPGGNRRLEGLGTPLQTVRNKVTEASLLTGSGRKSERQLLWNDIKLKLICPFWTSLGTRKMSMHPFDPWFYDNARKITMNTIILSGCRD